MALRGWFYPLMAVIIALVVFAGFAPTYYLKVFTGAPALPALVHVHGVVFSGWFALLIAQVVLVESGRRDVHRRLGVAGGVLAGTMVVLGVVVAIRAARRDVLVGDPNEALGFLIIPLGGMLAFSLLIGAALIWRARPNVHRRLMLLASLAILPAAIGRIEGLEAPGPFIVVFVGLLAAAPVYDLLRGRRPHPVSLWGGIGVFLFELVRFMAQQSPAWLAIARRLV